MCIFEDPRGLETSIALKFYAHILKNSYFLKTFFINFDNFSAVSGAISKIQAVLESSENVLCIYEGHRGLQASIASKFYALILKKELFFENRFHQF